MSVPVNLYVDRMSPVQPVRVADVYSVTHDRSSAYTEAAGKIGLTTREYAEFRQALTEGGAMYVMLPRHIDAMAGVHRRSGQVYALRNVVVPSGTMGWQVNLADGTTVLIPRVCGNLSMNHSRAIAHRPAAVVAQRKQPKAVRALSYVAPKPKPAEVAAATPVTFEAPVAVAPVSAPVAAVAAVGHASAFPFLGLLAPIAASLSGGGGGGGSHSPTFTPAAPPPAAPPCSLGSNTMGVCAR